MGDEMVNDGYSQPYIRTLGFTAAPNGNYALEFDFPSKAAYTVYDNPCNYAVITPIATIK